MQMNVFFVVATLSVVVLTISVGLVAYRVWRILEHVERIAGMAEGDITRIRTYAGALGTTFFEFFIPRSRRRHARSREREE